MQTPHYGTSSPTCIEAMESAWGWDATERFCVMNAFKYLWRAYNKGEFLDNVKKAHDYLGYVIERREG